MWQWMGACSLAWLGLSHPGWDRFSRNKEVLISSLSILPRAAASVVSEGLGDAERVCLAVIGGGGSPRGTFLPMHRPLTPSPVSMVTQGLCTPSRLPPPAQWFPAQGSCPAALGQIPLWVGCSEPDLVFVLLTPCFLSSQVLCLRAPQPLPRSAVSG